MPASSNARSHYYIIDLYRQSCKRRRRGPGSGRGGYTLTHALEEARSKSKELTIQRQLARCACLARPVPPRSEVGGRELLSQFSTFLCTGKLPLSTHTRCASAEPAPSFRVYIPYSNPSEVCCPGRGAADHFACPGKLHARSFAASLIQTNMMPNTIVALTPAPIQKVAG